MTNPLVDAQRFGQSIRYANIRPGQITSDERYSMIEHDSLPGISSNPASLPAAITSQKYTFGVLKQARATAIPGCLPNATSGYRASTSVRDWQTRGRLSRPRSENKRRSATV
jgi:hypothetical protein